MEKKEKSKATTSEHIDYKDTVRLKAYLNPHSRMFSRGRSGLGARAQRDMSVAIKRARFMALVPYVSY